MKAKNRMKIFLFITTILFSTATTAQDLFARKNLFSQFEPNVEKFQSLERKNTIGDYPLLPITDGMQIAWSKVSYSTGVVVPLGRIFSFAAKENVFFVALDVTANLTQALSSDWTDTPCKREDFLWKRSVGGNFQDINCASINHVVNYFVNPTGEFQQLNGHFKNRGIEIPPTIIRVQFTRYGPQTRRLVYTVDINPELYGITRDATVPWGSNSWHKEFVKRDEKKVKFIEHLTLWATNVQDRMNDAFAKSPMAFLGLKSLDDFLSASTIKAPNTSLEKSSLTEDKLLQLKSLYEKGLLTEKQYNDQVKAVLNSN